MVKGPAQPIQGGQYTPSQQAIDFKAKKEKALADAKKPPAPVYDTPANQVLELKAGMESGKVSQDEWKQFTTTGVIPKSAIDSGAVPTTDEVTNPNGYVSKYKPELTDEQKKEESANFGILFQQQKKLDEQQSQIGEALNAYTKGQQATTSQLSNLESQLQTAMNQWLSKADSKFTEPIKNEVSNYQSKTGKLVDFTNPQFTEQLGAFYTGASGYYNEKTGNSGLQGLFEDFSLTPQEAEAKGLTSGQAPVQPQIPTANNADRLKVPPGSPYDFSNTTTQASNLPPKAQLSGVLSNELGKTFATALKDLKEFDPSVSSSADMLTAVFGTQLGIIYDPAIDQYLSTLSNYAKTSYDEGVALADKGIKEIDDVINNNSKTVTTTAGLLAKIQKDTKDQSLTEIQTEKDYLDQVHAIQKAEKQEKLGRLEGYTKAKLQSMGASDSSAGVMLLTKVVHTAELEMQQFEADYNYASSKLTNYTLQALNNYSNNISGILIDTESQKASLKTAYDEKLIQIQEKKLTSDIEKKQQTLTAISNYATGLDKIKADSQKRKDDELKRQYDMIQDKKDEAYKLGGLTGTIWTADDKGNLKNTKIPTFDYNKWKDSSSLGWAQYNRGVENDAWDKAEQLLKVGKYEEAGLMIGESSDYFSQFATYDQKTKALALAKDTSDLYGALMPQIAGENGAISSMFQDGYTDGTPDGIQCGEYMHKFFTDYPYSLNTFEQKKALVYTERGSMIPEVGSAIIMDATYNGSHTGHIGIVSKIENGTIYYSDSNGDGKGTVKNNRTISINDPKIAGYWKGTLDPTVESMFVSANTSIADKYYKIAQDQGVEYAKSQLKEVYTGSQLENIMNSLNTKINDPFASSMDYSVPPKSLAEKENFLSVATLSNADMKVLAQSVFSAKGSTSGDSKLQAERDEEARKDVIDKYFKNNEKTSEWYKKDQYLDYLYQGFQNFYSTPQ